MTDFGESIKEEKAKSEKLADLMDEQLILYEKIKKVLPDVTGTWNHGCVSSYIVMESPIFTSKLVNKDYDILSYGGLGCCHESYENPYFVRPIKIVEGQRVRGLTKVCIGRYDDNSKGYDPEDKWEKDVRFYFGDVAVEDVRKFLDDNPYIYDYFKDDEDDDDYE